MPVRPHSLERRRAIAALAAGQHGVVTLAQLRRLGLSKSAIYDRVGGRLHRAAFGVFAVGHPLLSIDGRRLAAVLSLGGDAVLSHLSAAAAWGLLDHDDARFNVAVAHTSGGSTGASHVRPRRTRRLLIEDRTTLREIPITTVARTLLDLAGERGGRSVQRAVHEAEVLRLLDVTEVLATIQRNPGRRGARLLRRAVGGPLTRPHQLAVRDGIRCALRATRLARSPARRPPRPG